MGSLPSLLSNLAANAVAGMRGKFVEASYRWKAQGELGIDHFKSDMGKVVHEAKVAAVDTALKAPRWVWVLVLSLAFNFLLTNRKVRQWVS